MDGPNEGSLTVGAVAIPGTSPTPSARCSNKTCSPSPKSVSAARRTGRAELDEHVQSVEAAEIGVRLRFSNRPKKEVLAEIRDKATLMPGMNVFVGQPVSHRIDHMLSGTRNGIILISHIRHLMNVEGITNPREGVLRGAQERLIPLLMTALAAGLAFIPIALGRDEPGGKIQAAMAFVILLGLLSSTFLNVFIVLAA
jgi:Cu/Ag efflux pump CusA